MKPLDANEARSLTGGPSFPLTHRLVRLLWTITWFTLASWTPRQLHPWRRFLLRLFGARLAARTDVRGSVRIWYPANLAMGPSTTLAAGVICYNMAPITLGAGTIVSQRAHLCTGTHDTHSKSFQLLAQPITIGNQVWIAAEAFVGPNTVIGDGAVLGARAVAFGTLEPWTVYAGNPARILRARAAAHSD
jgi:putative colanic acid biosynthesis acetyltransferase WcaF